MKGHTYLVNLQLRLPGLFEYVYPFATSSIKGLKNIPGRVVFWPLLHIQQTFVKITVL